MANRIVKLSLMVNYLDWYDLLVNNITGDWIIFMLIALLIVAYITSKYSLPNQVFVLLLFIFGLLMAKFFGILLPIVLLLVGFFVGWAILKLITR